MKKTINYIIFFLLFVTSCGQKKRNSEDKSKTEYEVIISNNDHKMLDSTYTKHPKTLNEIVKNISLLNEVQEEHVTLHRGPNFINYRLLSKFASVNELLSLTNDTNNVVACYAGWALADRGYPNLKNIFGKFLDRKADVYYASGCERSRTDMASVLYYHYWGVLNDKLKGKDKILMELDSIILFEKNPFRTLISTALQNRIYVEPYKSQIEYLAFKRGNSYAIFYLCNWYRAEYHDRLKQLLIKYLISTNFKNSGITDYYTTLDELFKFKDPNINRIIILKMRKDRFWECKKEKFMFLLEENTIFDVDSD